MSYRYDRIVEQKPMKVGECLHQWAWDKSGNYSFCQECGTPRSFKADDVGYQWWEVEKYPPALRRIATVLLNHEEQLSDGFMHYLGEDADAGVLQQICEELRQATQK